MIEVKAKTYTWEKDYVIERFKEEKEESEKFQINRKRQREKVYG